MPKAIDRKLIDAIKRAYLDRKSKPTLKDLAVEFGVGLATLKNISSKEKWAELRKAASVAQNTGAVEAAKTVTRQRPKVDDLTHLDNAIADVSAEVAAIEAKSKEGCANALAALLKTKRDLYPPNAEELAEMAVKLGITPADFIRALKLKWADQDPSQQTA
jgi:hypothetical protein